VSLQNKEVADPSLTRHLALWSAIDLKTSLLKREWRGGDDILVVDLCPRAPPLRRHLLWHWRGAREAIQERIPTVIYIDDDKKTVDSWLKVGGLGFLLRCRRAGVPDMEFDGVSGCHPDQILSMVMTLSFASYFGGPKSYITAMEPRRAWVNMFSIPFPFGGRYSGVGGV
jgi:hypothetical protein